MRRALPLAVVLLALSAAPAAAHDTATAARLGAEVQAALQRAGIEPAAPVARVSGPRTLKLAIMPIQLPGATLPSTVQLTQAVADLNALYASATGAKLKVTAAIAPPYVATADLDPSDSNKELAKAIASAVANGVNLSGATPVFIAASEVLSPSYGGPALGALLVGPHWKMPSVWAHEIGHWQGLSHGRSPRCPTPGSIVGCDERAGAASEYGDFFDIMGSGADRFGVFQLLALGLYTPPDATPAKPIATVAPPGVPGPAALRIRTAAHDWFVEARSESHRDVFMSNGTGYDRFDVAQALPVGGVVVARAERRYTVNAAGFFPNPYRYAPAVGTPCTVFAICGASQVFSPGASLTVPGSFRLDVLPPAADGASRVKTTWLDRTPPVIKSIKGRIEKPWGSSRSTMIVDLVGASDGVGIAAVEVKAGSKTTRIGADALPDLISGKGKATVRIKAPRSGIVRTTLIDAAGRRSQVKGLKVSKLKRSRTNALTYAPRGATSRHTAVLVPAGTRVTVSVRMDPKLSGLPIVVGVYGPKSATTRQARLSRNGRATAVVALPKAAGIQVIVELPRKRGNTFKLVQQPTVYYTAG